MSTSMRGFMATLSSALLLTILTACSGEDSNAGHDVHSESAAANTSLQLAVYKSPTCGCCQFWIDHADAAGFQTSIHHPEDLTFEKISRGIGFQYHSCHTAVSPEGFVFEGHIPAKLISRFLTEKPEGAIGLAVPGMPIGSPGMEVGGQFSSYDVMLLLSDGSSQVYERVETAAEQH